MGSYWSLFGIGIRPKSFVGQLSSADAAIVSTIASGDSQCAPSFSVLEGDILDWSESQRPPITRNKAEVGLATTKTVISIKICKITRSTGSDTITTPVAKSYYSAPRAKKEILKKPKKKSTHLSVGRKTWMLTAEKSTRENTQP